jgi:diguanylate cyclase (GGDEF)-like protein
LLTDCILYGLRVFQAGGDEKGFQGYYSNMPTLTEHIIKLTDHRDRSHLELTLAKALIDLLRIDRVVLSRVISAEGVKRWLDMVALDVRGGGKVTDPLRIDFQKLPALEDQRDRWRCLQSRSLEVVAWAGAEGPRISYIPLYADASDDQGTAELHSGAELSVSQLEVVRDLLHVYRNMYSLLAYSDRDALTGLLNRKALDDTFYSAVLDELGEVSASSASAPVQPDQERRHRVPPNYWLGTISVDNFGELNDKNGHLLAEEILILVARVVNNTFRTYDRLYRLGAEQFAVLMHCPDEALVLAAFERFRNNMERFKFPQVGRVTASAGFARVTAQDSPSTALERAERAVDHARLQGDSVVVSHPELVRKGVLEDAPKVGAVDLF